MFVVLLGMPDFLQTITTFARYRLKRKVASLAAPVGTTSYGRDRGGAHSLRHVTARCDSTAPVRYVT